MSWDLKSVAAALGLLGACVVWAQGATDKRRSGFDTMSPRIQAMQRDDLQNPGMLWVADGEALWKKAAGTSASCAHCHGEQGEGSRLALARFHLRSGDHGSSRPGFSAIGVFSATAGIHSECTPGELLGRTAPNVRASRNQLSVRPSSLP